ncbi:uncharacterized protein LOC114263206 [Camellia sinensis]|uniref:uncharacterized protein LOC114263206 n=1 Tax=Camellia sinensis TaxID=4442 RepID=UPI0010367920|nr:uncharacterized protein LOC114263206 [Camellia sinensis]
MKKGFIDGCRPFIGVDGCHLKGPYGGVLISAVALDRNSDLFPLALAVVEGECKDNWTFFLENLRIVIEDALFSRPRTIMSVKQKGHDKIVSDIILEAIHRRCCMHLFINFRAKFPGLMLRKQFWKAARTYNHREYEQAMQAIKDISNDAFIWLQKVPVEGRTRHAFDARIRIDHITNNMTESFNNWLGNMSYDDDDVFCTSTYHNFKERTNISGRHVTFTKRQATTFGLPAASSIQAVSLFQQSRVKAEVEKQCNFLIEQQRHSGSKTGGFLG